MKLPLLALTLTLAVSAASAQQAPAPAAPGAAIYDMPCALFHHNADGSWNAVKAMTLQPKSGPIPLKTTFKIRTGILFAGFDLAAALDGACPHE